MKSEWTLLLGLLRLQIKALLYTLLTKEKKNCGGGEEEEVTAEGTWS